MNDMTYSTRVPGWSCLGVYNVSTCSAHKWAHRHAPGTLSSVQSYQVWSQMMTGRRDRANSYNGTALFSGLPVRRQMVEYV